MTFVSPFGTNHFFIQSSILRFLSVVFMRLWRMGVWYNCGSLWHSCLGTWSNLNTLDCQLLVFHRYLAMFELVIVDRSANTRFESRMFPVYANKVLVATPWYECHEMIHFLVSIGWRVSMVDKSAIRGHRMVSGVHWILVWRIGVI